MSITYPPEMLPSPDDGEIATVLVQCPKCEGRGYHHGFGEFGRDPDWCADCGGPGYIEIPVPTREGLTE